MNIRNFIMLSFCSLFSLLSLCSLFSSRDLGIEEIKRIIRSGPIVNATQSFGFNLKFDPQGSSFPTVQYIMIRYKIMKENKAGISWGNEILEIWDATKVRSVGLMYFLNFKNVPKSSTIRITEIQVILNLGTGEFDPNNMSKFLWSGNAYMKYGQIGVMSGKWGSAWTFKGVSIPVSK